MQKNWKLCLFDLYCHNFVFDISMIYVIIANMPQTATDQKTVTARLNENGRIVIPAEIRLKMDLKPGDAVVMTLDEDGILRIESHRARIRGIQEEFKTFAKLRVPMSDELIADRREEATREMEEWLG